MKKILMAIVVAVMLIGPAAGAAPIQADQSKACKSTSIVSMMDNISKIMSSYNKCLKAGGNSVKQIVIGNVTGKPCPTKNQTTATPKPSSGTTTAPKPSAATPKPTVATPKPTATTAPKPSPTATAGNVDNLSYEKQVVSLVNKERAAYGLSPLTLNTKLSNVARLKSQDMHDKHYFSHTSPTYGSPFDMMKSFGISYRAAGENIAMGYPTPEAVMDAWMNSPGHRANILNASYTQIGVGYVADGKYWTQEFIG